MDKYDYSDEKWKLKRIEVLKRDKYSCRGCGSKSNLHVHHSYYISGRKVWDYPLFSLITMCEGCHSLFHESIKGKELIVKSREEYYAKVKEELEKGFVAEFIPRFKIKKEKPKPKLNTKKQKKKFYKKKNTKIVSKPKKEKPKQGLTSYQKSLQYKRDNPI